MSFTVVSTIVSSGGAHHKQQRIELHSSGQELQEVQAGRPNTRRGCRRMWQDDRPAPRQTELALEGGRRVRG